MSRKDNESASWQRILGIDIDDKFDTLTECFKKNYKAIHLYWYRELGDWHEAEDMTQECFELIYERLFRLQDLVSEIPLLERNMINLCIKSRIRSIRWGRIRHVQRRIDMLTESVMHINPNSTETPLEAATNARISLAGPYEEVRIRNFIEDVKVEFGSNKIGDALLYIFFGCSHDEAQKKAGVSHGTFYRSLKDAKKDFGDIVSRHFDVREYNGID